MIRVTRHTKQRSLKYRIETALTRWAADITHSFLIWRKMKRIPPIVIKESVIAFGACSMFSLIVTLIGIVFNS